MRTQVMTGSVVQDAPPAFAAAAADEAIPVPLLPPPDDEGFIVGRDGRRYRVPDAAALAADIAAQDIEPRLDIDHQSEPGSPTHQGSTAALGWLRNPRVNEEGGITADLYPNQVGAAVLASGMYRYLSPGMRMERRTRRVVAVSSLALLNNPNFTLSLNSGDDGDDGDDEVDRRAAAEERREAREALLAAAEAVIDQAVESGRIEATTRDFHLAAVKNHKDGPAAGLKAFRELAAAAEPSEVARALTGRRSPRGQPSAGDGQAAGAPFPLPPGYRLQPGEETQLAAVRAHAKKHGISFRDAVAELGALED